jgi:hypothetical protein
LIFSWISAIPILGENPKLQHARANPLIEAKKKGPRRALTTKRTSARTARTEIHPCPCRAAKSRDSRTMGTADRRSWRPPEGPRQARPPLELLPIGRRKPRDRILKPNLPLELG